MSEAQVPPVVVQARPVRLRRICAVLAAAVLVTFGVIAALLTRSSTGVAFGPADQVAMFGLGVLIAAGILSLGRPSVAADVRGLHVRNVFGSHQIPWGVVRSVSFRDGAPWASLDLADDDTLALMAVQAADGDRAVRAVHDLRQLHEQHHRDQH